MIRYRDYVIKYIDESGIMQFKEESAGNTSEALEHFFQDADRSWSFVAIYEKR